ILVVWMRITGNQRCGRHDLARLTVAALNHFQREPRGLDTLPGRGRADSLDCGDLTLDGRDREYAGAHRVAVQMHGAGAALADAATKLCAGQRQHVTQGPKKW